MVTERETRGATPGSAAHLSAAVVVKSRLREALRARGISRGEAARMFGCGPETVRRWEDPEAPQDPRPGPALQRALRFVGGK